MKKLFIFAFAIMSISAFGDNLKDGKYSVKTDKAMWSWYPYTEFTVENGEIIDVKHNRVKDDGSLASDDKSFNKMMHDKSKSSPKEYSKLIPENFFKAGKDIDKIDNVAGATDSVNQFKKQYKFLINKGKPGNYTMKVSDL